MPTTFLPTRPFWPWNHFVHMVESGEVLAEHMDGGFCAVRFDSFSMIVQVVKWAQCGCCPQVEV